MAIEQHQHVWKSLRYNRGSATGTINLRVRTQLVPEGIPVQGICIQGNCSAAQIGHCVTRVQTIDFSAKALKNRGWKLLLE